MKWSTSDWRSIWKQITKSKNGRSVLLPLRWSPAPVWSLVFYCRYYAINLECIKTSPRKKSWTTSTICWRNITKLPSWARSTKRKMKMPLPTKKRSPTSNTACSVYGIRKLMLSHRLHICITLHLPTQRQHDLCRIQILLRSCKTTLPQIMTEQMSIYTENTLQR